MLARVCLVGFLSGRGSGACISGVTVLFFFFQAEDGIRDYKVTGVQTCALPISHRDGRLLFPLRFPAVCFLAILLHGWSPFCTSSALRTGQILVPRDQPSHPIDRKSVV